MDGGEDPSVKRKLLRNIKSKYVNEKIPSKRFLIMQGKSNKTYNKRSPLKYEIKMESEPKPEPKSKSNNSFITNSLQNIKKLKKEYIRKGGDDLDFLEKLNKKQIQLEKELFDNLESDFIKSNSFIFDTDQSGSGKARESTEEQKEARRKYHLKWVKNLTEEKREAWKKYQAEWVKNKRKNLTEEQKEAQKKRKAESYRRKEDWIKSLTEEKRIAYYKYKEAEDKKKNLTGEEKREARKKYQAEWVKNKRKNLTEEQKESARNKRKNLKIANILLKLKSGKRSDKETDKRSGTSPVMQGTSSVMQSTSSVMQGSGKIRSQYHGKQSKVMVKVPENVKNTALYSFKLKKLGFGGGLETGWKRAKQLATKNSISIQDLRYMRAWFARHIYTSYPTYKKWKKEGRPKTKEWHRKHGIISWLIWSGDAGFKWVNSQKNINLLNKHYNKNYKSMKLPK